jgi:hypothetical protein
MGVEDDKEVDFLRKIEVDFDGFGIYRLEVNFEMQLLNKDFKRLDLSVKQICTMDLGA